MLKSTARENNIQEKKASYGGIKLENAQIYRRREQYPREKGKMRRYKTEKCSNLPPERVIPKLLRMLRRVKMRKGSNSPPEKGIFRSIKTVAAGKNGKMPK